MGERLSVQDAMAELGVTEKTVRTWIRSGKLPASKEPMGTGFKYTIDSDDISQFLAPRVLAARQEAVNQNPWVVALSPVVAELATVREELQQVRAQLQALTEKVDKLVPSHQNSQFTNY